VESGEWRVEREEKRICLCLSWRSNCHAARIYLPLSFLLLFSRCMLHFYTFASLFSLSTLLYALARPPIYTSSPYNTHTHTHTLITTSARHTHVALYLPPFQHILFLFAFHSTHSRTSPSVCVYFSHVPFASCHPFLFITVEKRKAANRSNENEE